MQFSRKLYLFCCNFIHILALIFTGGLFVSAFLFTCYARDMTTQEVLTIPDNPLASIPSMVIFLFLLWIFRKPLAEHSHRIKPLLLALVLGWVLLSGGLLILFGRTAPAADAWSVYAAAKSLAGGDTSVIHPTGSYLSYYPQQVGLLAFLEVLVRLWNLLHLDLEAYHFIKCIYVILTCLIVCFQYRTVHLLWKNDSVDCIYLLLAGMNLPLIMYSSFVYGETPSFAALSVGIYFLLRLLREEENTTADSILSLLFLTLSVMLRKNSLILIIAVILVVLLEGLSQKRRKLYVYSIICMALAISILPFTQKIYEHRADSYLKSGVPAMSYFAMGMQESSRGNGWYNGFNFNTYESTGMDTRATKEISRNVIAERTTYFREHPDYAAAFYFNKYLSQWADGTYASRQATLATLGERHPKVKELYDGSYSPFYIGFCNLYQNIVYLGCFCCFFFRTWKRRPRELSLYLGIIGVFGGFLFHMLWEANARYIFLYGLLLIPYAAQGLFELSNTSVPAKIRRSSKARTEDEVQTPSIAG